MFFSLNLIPTRIDQCEEEVTDTAELHTYGLHAHDTVVKITGLFPTLIKSTHQK